MDIDAFHQDEYIHFSATNLKCEMKKPGSTPAPKSGKHEKFRKLAENRTNRALEAIARIGNLSNRHIYEFDESEVKRIVRALREAVATVEARFEAPRGKGTGDFRL